MRLFFLQYDRALGKLLDLREFDDSTQSREEAGKLRLAKELATRTDPNIENIVIGSDSAASLRRTHGRYFYTVAELAAGKLD